MPSTRAHHKALEFNSSMEASAVRATSSQQPLLTEPTAECICLYGLIEPRRARILSCSINDGRERPCADPLRTQEASSSSLEEPEETSGADCISLPPSLPYNPITTTTLCSGSGGSQHRGGKKALRFLKIKARQNSKVGQAGAQRGAFRGNPLMMDYPDDFQTSLLFWKEPQCLPALSTHTQVSSAGTA